MSAGGYVDVCKFLSTAGGTADFTFSTAVTGFQSPASAGISNGVVYSYRAESTDLTQWEIGFGAYNTGTGVLARTTVNASSTGSKVSFSVAPQVSITALTADLQNAALLTSGILPAARITFAVKADQTTSTSTTVPVNPAVQQFHPSAAKAWVTITGSTGAIQASYNVSGVVRNSAGDYTITFTTAFANANYAVLITGEQASLVSNGGAFSRVANGSRTTTTVQIQMFTTSVGVADPTTAHVAMFGLQ